MKAVVKLSNQLAGNFGLYSKQEGNGRVDLSLHWLTVGTQWNHWAITRPASELEHLLSCWYLARLIRPWRWRRYISPKCQLTFSGLHGVTSQKTELFICILPNSCELSSQFRCFQAYKSCTYWNRLELYINKVIVDPHLFRCKTSWLYMSSICISSYPQSSTQYQQQTSSNNRKTKPKKP
jgi:hypothetical protein